MGDDMDISRGLAAFNMIRQVRKALNDIQLSFTANNAAKAEYQVWLLWIMINEQPSRVKPWSHYQPRVAEEFES